MFIGSYRQKNKYSKDIITKKWDNNQGQVIQKHNNSIIIPIITKRDKLNIIGKQSMQEEITILQNCLRQRSLVNKRQRTYSSHGQNYSQMISPKILFNKNNKNVINRNSVNFQQNTQLLSKATAAIQSDQIIQNKSSIQKYDKYGLYIKYLKQQVQQKNKIIVDLQANKMCHQKQRLMNNYQKYLLKEIIQVKSPSKYNKLSFNQNYNIKIEPLGIKKKLSKSECIILSIYKQQPFQKYNKQPNPTAESNIYDKQLNHQSSLKDSQAFQLIQITNFDKILQFNQIQCELQEYQKVSLTTSVYIPSMIKQSLRQSIKEDNNFANATVEKNIKQIQSKQNIVEDDLTLSVSQINQNPYFNHHRTLNFIKNTSIQSKLSEQDQLNIEIIPQVEHQSLQEEIYKQL